MVATLEKTILSKSLIRAEIPSFVFKLGVALICLLRRIWQISLFLSKIHVFPLI